MKNYNFAKEITVFLCCLLLINRFPSYAGYRELPEWRETWGLETLADWIREDLGQSGWNPSAVRLFKKILQIGWAAVDEAAAIVPEALEAGKNEPGNPRTDGEQPEVRKSGQEASGAWEAGFPDNPRESIQDTFPVQRELTLSIHQLPRVGNGWKE